MFRATMGPSSGETTVYATLGTCYSVWMTVWYAKQYIMGIYIYIYIVYIPINICLHIFNTSFALYDNFTIFLKFILNDKIQS